MPNGNNGNQFMEDEVLVVDQIRDGEMCKSILHKIGARLRLAHEVNERLSIAAKLFRYSCNLDIDSLAFAKMPRAAARGASLGVSPYRKFGQHRLI